MKKNQKIILAAAGIVIVGAVAWHMYQAHKAKDTAAAPDPTKDPFYGLGPNALEGVQ